MFETLDWVQDTELIAASGIDRSREATEAERCAIAGALNLLALSRLHVDYSIRRVRRDCFLLKGQLHADVEQACGVTLDPVAAIITATIEVEFWPAERLSRRSRDGDEEPEFDPFATDDAEPIVNGQIEVGRIVYEQLASEVDPFPRSAEAELEQTQAPALAAGDTTGDTDNPFAVLSRLKTDGDDQGR